MKKVFEYSGLEVAIIGLACRVPEATDIDQFWDNLISNKCGIKFFSKEELEEAGISAEEYNNPKFIPAKGIIPGIEYFDSDFFKYTAREAGNMDPQIRIMHEEVYHALEDAGYASEKNKDPIGVFIGASNNFSWELKTNKETLENGWLYFSTLQLNDKDFISSRIAYSLNLRGPSVAIHTACSTSLYAVDMAYRHIITGACPVAVAGGIGLSLPSVNGYNTSVAGAYSADGYCRPFDKDASGTVACNGSAVVVLKSLEDAMNDGDRIYAVIRGTACNNDGSRKVGYTAPSVEGQAEVIKRALKMGQIPAESVSYVETHGTATKIGDPIELAALNKAYGAGPEHTIGIGSLKSNIGHTDTAAGAAAVIKTALSLYNKCVPASLFFKELNPLIDMNRSRFYVVSENQKLENKQIRNTEKYYPLRAGVSAFGIGGTNVHMILEEPPECAPSDEGREWNTFCISANCENSLKRLKEKYIEHLKKYGEEIKPSDLAWSLQTRQRKMKYRFSMAFHTIEQLCADLEKEAAGEPNIGHESLAGTDEANVYFMFPGHGSQYVGMTKDLYETEPDYQKIMDNCFDKIKKICSYDLKPVLFGEDRNASELMQNAEYAQLALFAVEYGLAELLIGWGIKPAGLIGHSLGEYVAACVAGVFSLEDGIRAVVERGNLINRVSHGAMVVVNTSAENIQELLGEGVSVATINTHGKCTVSGKKDAVEEFIGRLKEKEIQYISMESKYAAHSVLMEDVKKPLTAFFGSIELKEPVIPYVSNLTGTWIKAEEATDPSYYGKHVRETVRFADGIDTIMADRRAVLVELGAKKVLSAFAIQTAETTPAGVMNILPDQMEHLGDGQYIAAKLGELWDLNVGGDWKKLYTNQKRSFVKIPYYPFEPTEYKIGNIDLEKMLGLNGESGISGKENEKASYRDLIEEKIFDGKIEWREAPLEEEAQSGYGKTILLLTDRRRMLQLKKGIRKCRWINVKEGDEYSFMGNRVSTVRENSAEDIEQLMADLRSEAMLPEYFLIAESSFEKAKNVTGMLLKKISSVDPGYCPKLIILAAGWFTKDEFGIFVKEINCVKAETGSENVLIIGINDSYEDEIPGQKEMKILQNELSANGHEEAAVLYADGWRCVPEYGKILSEADNNSEQAALKQVLVISDEADHDACVGFCMEYMKREKGRVHLLEYSCTGETKACEGEKESVRELICEPPVCMADGDDPEKILGGRLGEKEYDGYIFWNVRGSGNDDRIKNTVRGLKNKNAAFLMICGLHPDGGWTEQDTELCLQYEREKHGKKELLLLDAGSNQKDYKLLGWVAEEMLRKNIKQVILSPDDNMGCALKNRSRKYFGDENPENVKERISDALREIWEGLFGVKNIGIDSDFFRLGGDSFKIMQIAEKIEKMGYRITMNEMYEYPTIRTMAEYLTDKVGQNPEAVDTPEKLESRISEQCGCECRMLPAQGDLGYILCAEEGKKKEIEKIMSQKDISSDIVPAYILTKSEADKLKGEHTIERMTAEGILKENDEAFFNGIAGRLSAAYEKWNHTMLSQPVDYTYKIGTTQLMFLKGDSRVNLYSIDFKEAVDTELLSRAICDVIGKNSLLHSVLRKKGRKYLWDEYAAPDKMELELFDISGYAEEFQQRIVKEIVEKAWVTADRIIGAALFQVCLLKWNEKHYELLFFFDHSIVDLISGQVIRRQVTGRYEELKAGSRMACPKAIGYDYYLEFVKRGPSGVSADEIVEKLELKKIHDIRLELGNEFERNAGKMQKVQISARLDEFQAGEMDEQKRFDITMQLFVKTLAKVLNLEEVPFDLIYTNRTYGKMNFTDMVGPTVDAASFLISVSENEPLRISGKISEKIKYCIDNNMNFTNMEWNLPTIWKWRKLVKYMGNNPSAAKGQVLFNYAGQVEKEYDKIFERSIDMFDEEHQDTFDFGNFYVVAKSSEEELQFIFFTKVVKDAGAIEEAFEKAAADLKEYYKKYHKELIMEEEK